MIANEESLTDSLAMFSGDGLHDAELERRVTRFQGALRRLREDPREAARIDAIANDAEQLSRSDTRIPGAVYAKRRATGTAAPTSRHGISAMHKMAIYLGLVEDEQRYDNDYDSYDGYDEYGDLPEDAEVADDGIKTGYSSSHHTTPIPTADLSRITTLHPRTYNEARIIGEHFREGTPVIMDLTEMTDSDAKRLVDFAAGLIFGLHGSIDRVTNRVFLLSPANLEVTAEDKARIAERGFFNQS